MSWQSDHIRIAQRLTDDYVNHGGVAIISKAGITIANVNSGPKTKTFEQQCCRIISKVASFILMNIYHPGSKQPTSEFFREFTTYLEFLRLIHYQLLSLRSITGEINIHLYSIDDSDTVKLTRLLESFNIVQLCCWSDSPARRPSWCCRNGIRKCTAKRHCCRCRLVWPYVCDVVSQPHIASSKVWNSVTKVMENFNFEAFYKGLRDSALRNYNAECKHNIATTSFTDNTATGLNVF